MLLKAGRLVDLLALASTALLACSCIFFERQTMVLDYDPAKDRVRIFQLYEGIHGQQSGDALNRKENAEIASVLERQRTFFFSNWILEYDRSGVEEFLADTAVGHGKDAHALAKLLLDNVAVVNGRFFLSPDGRLSGYQFVTLDNASKVVAVINRTISSAITRSFAKKNEKATISEESRRRILAAADEGHEWIHLDTNTVSVRYPLTREDFTIVRRDMADSLARRLAPADSRGSESAEVGRWPSLAPRSDLTIAYVDGSMVVTLGRPENARAQLTLNTSATGYKPNVVPFATSHGGLEDSPDLEKLMAEFFGSR